MRHPIPRTTSFKNSFFLATTDMWNSIDNDLNNCTSLNSFKQTLKKRIPIPPKQFSFGNRRLNILTCQLRNDKSQLNLNLFNDHLSNSAKCQHCNCDESVDHFLFECPNYTDLRYNLINSLMSHPDIYSNITITSKDLLGNAPNLSYENNCVVLSYVMEYIQNTKRL